MAICRLSIDICNNEPILKVQCKIQDIEGILRIYQLEFDSGIDGIDVLGGDIGMMFSMFGHMACLNC